MIFQCCAEVWERGAFRPSRCSRNGTVKANNRWYCKQHSPEQVKARNEAREARYQARSSQLRKDVRIRELRDRLVAAVMAAYTQKGSWDEVERLADQLIREKPDDWT